MINEGMLIGERYEILGLIGSGGMADVYKARDSKLNRLVAVKVLRQEFRMDKTFVGKFQKEAQAAAGLSHPNIVSVYDVGEDENANFIVMELVEGITLKDYIKRKKKLSVREATSIAIQVSLGLEAAHKCGLVHRDVKPQNIMISTDGKVKLSDFGIARAASSNTISSNVMGSVHYSSPEQVRGGFANAQSDIYSLGITLYEMVTGRVPFDGDTSVSIAIKHLQEEIIPPNKYVPDLPYSLNQIILKCTQKSVDRRYASMADLIMDLKRSLVDPNGNFVELAPLSSHAQTIMLSKAEMEAIQAASGSRYEDDDDDDVQTSGKGKGKPAGQEVDVEALKAEWLKEQGDAVNEVKMQFAALEKLRAANAIDPELIWQAGLIDKTKLSVEADGTIKGLDEAITDLTKNRANLFNKGKEGVPGGTGKDGGDESFATVKTKEDFLKLSTKDQLAFKQANPEMFKSFLNS